MTQRKTAKRLISVFVAGFALFAGTQAYAAHPLVTDDAWTQGKGRYQLEVNGEYGHEQEDGSTEETTQIAATLTYGVADPMDIVISQPYQFIRMEDPEGPIREDGFSDVTLEAKWRFYEQEGLGLAIKPGITLPAGNEEKGLGAGKATYHLFLIASKELAPWAFHLNFGYIRNENKNGERKNLFHASFASTVDAAKNLKIAGNVGIESDTDRNATVHPVFILGGLIYSLSEKCDVDVGVKGGLTRPETDYSLLAGLTYRF
jgi:hypothetical protein